MKDKKEFFNTEAGETSTWVCILVDGLKFRLVEVTW